MREDRRGSASLPIYHWPWPDRLWNFRDSFNAVAGPQSGTTHGHKKNKKNKGYVLPCLPRGVRVAMQGSREISGFLLLLSQEGNSCREGNGVRGIGESVVRQDQKIALCQTTVILIVKGKHIWCKRRGSGEESTPDLMGFFHRQTVICRETEKTFFIITSAM